MCYIRNEKTAAVGRGGISKRGRNIYNTCVRPVSRSNGTFEEYCRRPCWLKAVGNRRQVAFAVCFWSMYDAWRTQVIYPGILVSPRILSYTTKSFLSWALLTVIRCSISNAPSLIAWDVAESRRLLHHCSGQLSRSVDMSTNQYSIKEHGCCSRGLWQGRKVRLQAHLSQRK